jgi:hypothetical protein
MLQCHLIHRPQAYEYLDAIVQDPSKLTVDVVCDIHARLVDTARFNGPYIPPGQTRDMTQSVVFIHRGVDGIGQPMGASCCPLRLVTRELNHVCEQTQVSQLL